MSEAELRAEPTGTTTDTISSLKPGEQWSGVLGEDERLGMTRLLGGPADNDLPQAERCIK